MKAKSRLKISPESETVTSLPSPISSESQSAPTHSRALPHPTTHESISKIRHKLTPPRTDADKQLPLRYLTHLSTFFLCLPFYAVLYFIVTTYHPAELKNVLLPGWYLGFQIPFFLGNFFLLSFMLLNSRRGLALAITIQLLIFLKLQSVLITWQVAIFLVIFYLAAECLSFLMTRTPTLPQRTSVNPKKAFIPRRSRHRK